MKISIRFYNIREVPSVPSTSSGTEITASSDISGIRDTVVEPVETTAETTAMLS